MNFDKYDKLIWRILGTLLLTSTIVGITVVTITFFINPRVNKKSDVVSADSSSKEKISFSFHQATELEKTDYIMMEATNRAAEKKFISGGYHLESTNIMLINHRTNERFWILEHSDTVVRATRVYEKDDKNKKVLGLLLEISDSKNNETKNLKYYDLASKRLSTIVTGVHKYINSVALIPNEILVFYIKNENAYFNRFNLKTFRVTEQGLSSPPI